jgi:hypothetical protein
MNTVHMKLLFIRSFIASIACALVLAGCGGGGGGGTAAPGGTTPAPVSRTIGGAVSGLVGSVVLQDNGGDNLTLSANGNFSFVTNVASGSAYQVTVLTQPAGMNCAVTHGSGTASGNVTNVSITCTILPTVYATWSNSANGTTIKDAANYNFAVNTSTRAVVELVSNAVLTGLTVDTAATVLYNGTAIGSVTLATSTTGSPIAVFTCSNGSAMTITVTTGWSYSCSVGGGGGGSNYVTWINSANGTTIKDGANNNFAVDASTRAVVMLANNTTLTGLTVNTAATVLYNGTVIGSVTLAASTTGSQIAVFTCSNGSTMTITYTTGWFQSCSGNSSATFSVNETSEINATLTGASPNYVSSSTLTLTATTTVWAFSWSEYTASFWAVDATNAQLLMNGSAFSGYPLASAGHSGFGSVTLPAGTWYVGAVPNQTIDSSYSNRVYAEMSSITLPGFSMTNNFPVGTGAVNPGGWQSTPFTINSGTREYIETEGAGGTFVVMDATQANNFATTYSSGFFGGSYAYTYACGTTSGSPALEIECEMKLPPGNYALVYINTGSSTSGGAANIAVFQ